MSTSRSSPTVDTTTSRLVNLAVPAPSWANIAFSVVKPQNGAFRIASSGASYIWASSDSVPEGGNLDYHDDRGSAGVINFTDGAPAAPPSAPGNPASPTQTASNRSGSPSQPTNSAASNSTEPGTSDAPLPDSEQPTSSGEGDPTFALPDGVDYVMIIKYHGFIMIFAWVVAPFTG